MLTQDGHNINTGLVDKTEDIAIHGEKTPCERQRSNCRTKQGASKQTMKQPHRAARKDTRRSVEYPVIRQVHRTKTGIRGTTRRIARVPMPPETKPRSFSKLRVYACSKTTESCTYAGRNEIQEIRMPIAGMLKGAPA